jgi:signal transduction histidine kinase
VPIAIAHDRSCQFISANLALATLLGVPLGTNISMTPPGHAAPSYRIQRNGRDLPESELPMQQAIAQRTSIRNDIEIVRSDGSVAYVQNDVEPLYDTQGNVYGCVSVCVDLTEQKLAQLALLEADRRKDEFLATLSHELRNPLAPLRSALEVMRLARDKPDVVEKARLTMERQLMQLVRVTDDLLDVARITQNKLEMRRARRRARRAARSGGCGPPGDRRAGAQPSSRAVRCAAVGGC